VKSTILEVIMVKKAEPTAKPQEEEEEEEYEEVCLRIAVFMHDFCSYSALPIRGPG